MKWDLFCAVIDNYGDVGVCWRLARQLAEEHGQEVRLWVDELSTLELLLNPAHSAPSGHPLPVCKTPQVEEGKIAPLLQERGKKNSPSPACGRGVGERVSKCKVTYTGTENAPAPLSAGNIPPGVEIRPWSGKQATPLDFGGVADIADVVIEAFACALPENYETAMAQRKKRPCWINLEYLSAEEWVCDCHLRPSPHPRLPLEKTFFFPGFTPQTGGLLRERGLLERQRRFLAHSGRRDLFAALGLHSLISDDADALVVSLFCYEDAPIRALIDAWRQDSAPILVLVPPGKPRRAVEAALPPGEKTDDAPVLFRSENLCLAAIPFLPQMVYDELLWSCDLNFIRGEDSFVRAQWAGAPFVWQPYPQTEDTHAKKLHAFLDRFTTVFSAPERALLTDFWRAWNGLPTDTPMPRLWPAYRRALPALGQQTRHWRDHLAKQEDLVSALVRFCQSRV